MKKALIFLLIPLIMGAIGFFVGRLLVGPPEAEAAPPQVHVTAQAVLYKMPLGKFTIQVLQPGRILHVQIDMDVYIAGLGKFDELNGTEGKARLRDAIVAIGSDLAETELWIEEGTEDQLDHEKIAELIVRKLHRSFSSVRSARINRLDSIRSARH